MRTSKQGRKFIYREEGCPLTVYLDVGGVATVGPGLSNNSRIVVRMLGKLKRGTRYTQDQLDPVFAAVLANETEPAVQRGLPGCSQQEFDGAASGTYNLGPAYPTWQWASLWRKGRKHEAFQYVRSHYNTVRGRRVAGLVARREREADLMEFGQYGAGITAPEGQPRAESASPPATPDPMVKEAQKILTDRGFDPGAVDGWMGPETKAAIKRYQQFHPDLANDGILGPATMAQLRRDAGTVGETVRGIAGSGVATTAATATAGLQWQWVALAAGIVVVCVAGYILWRHRDIVTRRFNTLTNKKVGD